MNHVFRAATRSNSVLLLLSYCPGDGTSFAWHFQRNPAARPQFQPIPDALPQPGENLASRLPASPEESPPPGRSTVTTSRNSRAAELICDPADVSRGFQGQIQSLRRTTPFPTEHGGCLSEFSSLTDNEWRWRHGRRATQADHPITSRATIAKDSLPPHPTG